MIVHILFLAAVVLILAVMVIAALWGAYTVGKDVGYWKRVGDEKSARGIL